MYLEFKEKISRALEANPDFEKWDPLLTDATTSGWFNMGARELFTGFPISEEDHVLDLGCGDGAHANFCAKLGAKITLVDIEQNSLNTAADRVAEVSAKPSRKVLHNPDDRLPLERESFTRVICLEVLEHTDNPVALLEDIVTVGKPGALYLISVPAAESELIQKEVAPEWLFEKPNHINIFTSEQFAQLVEQSGLEILGRHNNGFFWSMWWILFWLEEKFSRDDSLPQSTGQWLNLWAEIIRTDRGRQIKKLLDDVLPKSQVIVARKP